MRRGGQAGLLEQGRVLAVRPAAVVGAVGGVPVVDVVASVWDQGLAHLDGGDRPRVRQMRLEATPTGNPGLLIVDVEQHERRMADTASTAVSVRRWGSSIIAAPE